MSPAAFDERQHLADLVRDTNYVTALRLGNFEIHQLPQHLTRGFAGPPHWQVAFRVCFLAVSLPAGIAKVMALL